MKFLLSPVSSVTKSKEAERRTERNRLHGPSVLSTKVRKYVDFIKGLPTWKSEVKSHSHSIPSEISDVTNSRA